MILPQILIIINDNDINNNDSNNYYRKSMSHGHIKKQCINVNYKAHFQVNNVIMSLRKFTIILRWRLLW